MALVNEQQVVLGEVVKQGVGNASGRSARKYAGVVFYSLAEAYLFKHLNVVQGALLYALSLHKLALLLKPFYTFIKLLLYLLHSLVQMCL